MPTWLVDFSEVDIAKAAKYYPVATNCEVWRQDIIILDRDKHIRQAPSGYEGKAGVALGHGRGGSGHDVPVVLDCLMMKKEKYGRAN